jgi:hypothetical protein
MSLQDTDNLLVSRGGTNYRMPAVQLKDYAGAKVSLSETAPVDPDIGVLWWNSSTGRLYVWYGDVDSAQWVETSPQGIDENIFVNAAGDTMTGTLTVPTLNTTTLNGGQLAGLRNRIINGDFRVDQRNGGAAQTIAATTNNTPYTADRFYAYCTGANVTGQRITVAGAEKDPFRYQFTGVASVTGISIAQRIEADNCRDLADTIATLSVKLSNSLLTTVTWTAYYANTTDSYGTLTVPTKTQIATGTFTVNSTYSRYSTQIAIPAAATTGIEIVFSVGAQTSGTWVLGQVQLEVGSIATPFEQRSIAAETLLCQRYFEWLPYHIWGYSASVGGTIGSSLTWVAKRVVPTVAYPISGAFLGMPAVQSANIQNPIGVAATGTAGGYAYLTGVAAGFAYIYHYTCSASAEL